MKKRSNHAYAVALYQALQGKTATEQKHIASSFVALLARHYRLGHAQAIIDDFIRYAKRQSGTTDLVVTTISELVADITKRLQTIFGSDAAVTTHIDKSIIGGIIVQTEETVFDGSIRKQLERLKSNLIQ